MNTKHSVNAPALSSKRSMLRRFATVFTAASVLMLGIASASADGKDAGKGSYELTTIAGVGDNFTGKLDVKGDGKFRVEDDGTNLVFTSHVGGGRQLNMKDGRQEHTTGKRANKEKYKDREDPDEGTGSKIPGMGKDTRIKLTIEKSKLTFPEAGKEVSGTVPAKVNFLKEASTVNVKYTVKEDGGKYVIKSASFDFDYTKHVGGKKVCLMLVCVKPMVTITVTNGVIEAKK